MSSEVGAIQLDVLALFTQASSASAAIEDNAELLYLNQAVFLALIQRQARICHRPRSAP